MTKPSLVDGHAIVYCDRAFRTTYGKTAHGLVRRTSRYEVLSVIDGDCAGHDAADILPGVSRSVPIVGNLRDALSDAERRGTPATHFVVGVAPDGGAASAELRRQVLQAIECGLNIDSGLHTFFSEDEELQAAATQHGVVIRDVRKPPPRSTLHFFSGKIEQVNAQKIAVLGTDSAIGKRTTAWILVDAFCARGRSACLVGTGQTAWLQGAVHSVVMDALVNDFVPGEIEHAVWSAWNDLRPDVIVIEGQGSLMNPAYPGGLEILGAGRPDQIVLQHVPGRVDYDGFPGYPIHPIEQQIDAVELLSGKPVAAITINAEGLDPAEVPDRCAELERRLGRPVRDVLRQGAEEIVEVLSRGQEAGVPQLRQADP